MTRRTKACERKGLQQHSMGGKEKAVRSLSNNHNPNDFKNTIFPTQIKMIATFQDEARTICCT